MGRYQRELLYVFLLCGFAFYGVFFGFIFLKTLDLKRVEIKHYALENRVGTTDIRHPHNDRDRNCTMVSMQTRISSISNIKLDVLQKTPLWRNVSFCDRNYVFSGYLYFNKVTIVAVTTRDSLLDKSLKYYCRFHNTLNPSNNVCNETIAQRKPMPENRGKRYSAAFYTCQLPGSSRPYAVSLSTDHCKTPSNIIPIVYPQEQKRKFTVCVTPLNFRYSKAYELVEMIELNRILGADFFTFYNYSTDGNVDKVLEYYKKKGLLEVLEWNLPMKVDTWPKKKGPVEIHYFGQLAALNDCLYRNMYISKYIVFQDLDEFIIPQKHLTWTEMIKALPPDSASYMFQCVFFRKEWADTDAEFTGKDTAKQFKMNTLLKQKREPKFLGRSHRSKYIVNPAKIDTVGIHNVWRYRSGSKAHYVDPQFARLHHYRNWLNPNDSKKGIIDNRIMVYKDDLLTNTKRVWEALKNVPLGPLNEA